MMRTPLYTAVRKFLPWFFRILMPIRVRNEQYLPRDGRVIVCSNHLSMTDPVRLAYATHRQIFYMAKEELFRNPLVGGVIRALGAFPVMRGRGDRSALLRAREILNGESALGIFIEGHRSPDGKMLRPKSGAVRIAYSCNTPIVPCCITAKGGGLPRLFHTCRISFGRPIEPGELQIGEATPSEFRRAAHLVMDRIAELRREDLQEWQNGRVRR